MSAGSSAGAGAHSSFVLFVSFVVVSCFPIACLYNRFAFGVRIDLITAQADDVAFGVDDRFGHTTAHRFTTVGFVESDRNEQVAGFASGLDSALRDLFTESAVGEADLLCGRFFIRKVEFIFDKGERLGDCRSDSPRSS